MAGYTSRDINRQVAEKMAAAQYASLGPQSSNQNCMEEPAVLSQVQEQISLLANENENLIELATRLRAGLAPVLAERGCGIESNKNDSPEPSLCTLASQIRHQRHNTGVATAILSEILYSLEV